MEQCVSGDVVVTLLCQHTFHQVCIDTWTAQTVSRPEGTRCPQCRNDVTVVAVTTYEPPTQSFSIATPNEGTPVVSDAGSGYQTPASMFPWWPEAFGVPQHDPTTRRSALNHSRPWCLDKFDGLKLSSQTYTTSNCPRIETTTVTNGTVERPGCRQRLTSM